LRLKPRVHQRKALAKRRLKPWLLRNFAGPELVELERVERFWLDAEHDHYRSAVSADLRLAGDAARCETWRPQSTLVRLHRVWVFALVRRSTDRSRFLCCPQRREHRRHGGGA